MPLHVLSTRAHRHEAKIVLYRLSQPVHRTATYRCDDSRGCIVQFRLPDDEHMVLETCIGLKQTHYKI